MEESRRRREVGAYYAEAFGTPAGMKVLADLRAKFDHRRARYPLSERSDHTRAAVIDGQCSVLGEIEDAIEAGSFRVLPTNPQTNGKTA